MPTATLTYNLPEEQEDFTLATKGMDMFMVLQDLHEYLRRKLKYEQEYKSGIEEIEDIQQHVFNLMAERNVSMDIVV